MCPHPCYAHTQLHTPVHARCLLGLSACSHPQTRTNLPVLVMHPAMQAQLCACTCPCDAHGHAHMHTRSSCKQSWAYNPKPPPSPRRTHATKHMLTHPKHKHPHMHTPTHLRHQARLAVLSPVHGQLPRPLGLAHGRIPRAQRPVQHAPYRLWARWQRSTQFTLW